MFLAWFWVFGSWGIRSLGLSRISPLSDLGFGCYWLGFELNDGLSLLDLGLDLGSSWLGSGCSDLGVFGAWDLGALGLDLS